MFVYEAEVRGTGNSPERRNTCERATFSATFLVIENNWHYE